MKKVGGWCRSEQEKGIHVYPVGDLREHVLSLNCWCKPKRDDEAPLVIVHNSMDGREEFETGKRKVS